MNPADTEQSESLRPQNKLPALPTIWIGYALGLATILARSIAVYQNPDLEKTGAIAPLYVFLPAFIALVYWLVCIHRYHVILKLVPGWKHPISPARAVGFHFLPFYFLYWFFKWPKAIAQFVNFRLRSPVMKPLPVGIAIFGGWLVCAVDPGLGLMLLFFPMSYISECIRRALAAPNSPPPTEPNDEPTT